MNFKDEKDELNTLLTAAHDEHRSGLHAHASFKTRDNSLANDIVQSTFMKTWLYLLKGGKIQTMKAFLYHVLNDLIVDEYRKHKTTSLDILLEKGFDTTTSGAVERMTDAIDGKQILSLIQRLPKTYQKIIYMRYIQDLSLKEIASITKQSRATTAVQVHRGLAKLKTMYRSQKIIH